MEAPFPLHGLDDVGPMGHDVPHHEVAPVLEPRLPHLPHLHVRRTRGRWIDYAVGSGGQLAVHDDDFLRKRLRGEGTCGRVHNTEGQLTGFSPHFRSLFLPKSAAYNHSNAKRKLALLPSPQSGEVLT